MPITITKATAADLNAVVALYDQVTDQLAATTNYPGWQKGSYPTRRDAAHGLAAGHLFTARVTDAPGKPGIADAPAAPLAGSFILLPDQEPAYLAAPWATAAAPDSLLVLHTFTVSPGFRGQGVARAMLQYAADYAAAAGKTTLRLDVYANNTPAIRLYETSGFRYVSTVSLGLEAIGLDWFRLYEKPL